MNTVSRFLADLVFPNRCPCCDDFIRWDKLICGKCHRSIETVYEKACPVCGLETCICSEENFCDRSLVPLRYETLVKEGVLSLKRGNNKNFGEYAGKLIAGILKNEMPELEFDMIMPVPMSPASFRKRGFNQAEIIAGEIAAALDIPLVTDVLIKLDTDSSQHYLNKSQRMRNITSIKIKETDLTGKRIIICDDVITTGSTINRCARLLNNSGAETVFAAAAAGTKLR
ncbi:MAG: ComF family protein [Oscillospiraceae bacterium]|nr:ComF family protein [Oscillospiraceae bacterium]